MLSYKSLSGYFSCQIQHICIFHKGNFHIKRDFILNNFLIRDVILLCDPLWFSSLRFHHKVVQSVVTKELSRIFPESNHTP